MINIAGKTFCESSTIHPDLTVNIEKLVTEKKAGFVAGAPSPNTC
jgi:3-hydroxyisobutyrate dehydrogenase-like beta-hydroxyacid dehydrogenase